MAAKQKELIIEIDDEGKIYIEAVGFEGKGCHVAIEDLRKSLGKVTSSKKKAEFYQKEQVKVNQSK